MPSEDRMLLLNPGPVTLTGRVRKAFLRRDLCHREPEFAALQTDVRDRLARVYPEAEGGYAPVLLTGSGAAAVEAMVGSLVPHEGKALIVANGVYGERIAPMLEAQRKPFHLVRSAWTDPVPIEAAKQCLDTDPRITHVVAIHHETTTGRLNDMEALGALCRTYDIPLLLDAVSSFGGERIDFAGWNVEGCAATANKCLHGAPGISFVLCRKHALETRPSGASSVYLDLFRNHREQATGYPMFTPAVQVLFALQEALIELEEAGGWMPRHARYRALSRALRQGLQDRGIPLLLKEEGAYSAILSSFMLPAGVPFPDLYTRLKAQGFVIYPGQHALKETIFRVAVMGDLSPEDIQAFIRAFAAAVEQNREP